MVTTIALPENSQYLAASLLSVAILLVGQGFVVGGKRKAAGIQYPQLYAEKAQMDSNKDAFVFNCAQRAHQNTLESVPVILTTTLLTAINYPTYAASALGIWTFSRVLYTIGYVTGDPAKRNTRGGAIGSFALLGLLGASSVSVFKLLTA